MRSCFAGLLAFSAVMTLAWSVAASPLARLPRVEPDVAPPAAGAAPVDWSDLEAEHPREVSQSSMSVVGFGLVGAGLAVGSAGSAASIPDDSEALLALGAITGSVLVLSGVILFVAGASR